VSAEDAEVYAAWLRINGKVPGARLCSELEWERAARGADERIYPHGDVLRPGDINVDMTYGRTRLGPDEVGLHPASRSPYGVDDMSGNAFEWTTSALLPRGYAGRGGSCFHDRKSAQLVNRAASTASVHDQTVGFRLCASIDF
jgi:formylglycine-generating enzyme required for sulfatase activity